MKIISVLSFCVVICLATYVGLGALVYAKQDALLFQRSAVPNDVHLAGVAGLRSVLLRTADGLELAAWYRPPAPGAPTVLYFHGNGGNVMNRTYRVRLLAQTQ